VTASIGLCNAIIARLNTDETIKALVLGGFREFRGPARGVTVGAGYPYVVVMCETTGEPRHAGRGDGFMATVRVTVVDEVANGVARIEAIIARIFGDASLTLSLGGVPSYGLHRHMIEIDGATGLGWKGSQLVCQGGGYSIDEDELFLSHTTTFEVAISRFPT